MDYYRPPSLQGVVDGLGSVYRALRAWKFYPKGHPNRKNSIKQAHGALLTLLDGNNLSLNCGRSGFSFPDGEVIKDTTRMSASLSHELFIRRVQKITFLQDLHQEDLLDFLRILTILPETIQKSGGMDKLMAEHGIRTIWANEFDFSIIRGKRRTIEDKGIIPLDVDQLENDGLAEIPGTPDLPDTRIEDVAPEEELQSLVGQLAVTTDEHIYTMLIRKSISCSDLLKASRNLLPLLPLVKLLAAHANDAGRSATLRDSAGFGLEQLAMGDDFLVFLLDRMEGADEDKGNALAILAAAGPSAVALAVEKMGATENLAVRKELTTLIVRLGEPAVPPLVVMLGDSRWYIVRNLAAILGDIGSPKAVPELQKCLQHDDIRVCKETIRSLAKIGGREAEAAVVTVLRGNVPALLPQAITSLGGMKSRRSLVDLMRIVCAEDMFLKSLPLKIEALNAIALIGDQQVTPTLIELFDSRHLIASGRWAQFKIAIANCLGKLADPRALTVLKKKSASSGGLGQACAEAIELIERTGGDIHGDA